MIPTLKHTFTTKHFSHNKNYEWNIPNIHECYRSQRGTAVTIARAVVLNHLLQVLKWPSHTTRVLCALCRSIHPICTWLVLCCPQGRVQWRGVGGGGRCQESGMLRTGCGAASRKEGCAGHRFPKKSGTVNYSQKTWTGDRSMWLLKTWILFSQVFQCLRNVFV